MLRILKAADYVTVPWKNGRGTTDDILVLPEGASHADFDVRISRAPIVDPAPFSSFPGIDRTITRIDPAPLSLAFADGTTLVLRRLYPQSFDSALAPVPVLTEGATRVLNVMTRRGRFSHTVEILPGGRTVIRRIPAGGLVALYQVEGGAALPGEPLGSGQTAIVTAVPEIKITVGLGGHMLVATVTPASGPG